LRWNPVYVIDGGCILLVDFIPVARLRLAGNQNAERSGDPLKGEGFASNFSQLLRSRPHRETYAHVHGLSPTFGRFIARGYDKSTDPRIPP